MTHFAHVPDAARLLRQEINDLHHEIRIAGISIRDRQAISEYVRPLWAEIDDLRHELRVAESKGACDD